ncbi:hypothetical protein F4X86_03020 [Candidatus Saccharibacteria bacterium]|nr:hypothetical protein [Candidatus Saccharibacteria bacterium]
MNKLFKISALSVIGVLSAILLAGPVAATLRTSPVFNAYDGVQLHYGVGSESDFLRLGNSGDMGNALEVCEDGQTVDLWFYVHNSTAASANGADFDGPGVATNTVIGLDVNENAEANSHSVVASIDSDQTNPITDDVTITCADKNIRLVYKAVTHFATSAPALTGLGNFTLVGDLQDGASLGYQRGAHKGVVPGCWQYRARLNIQLEVQVVEEVEEEPVREAEEPEEEPEEATTIIDTGVNDAINLTVAMLVLGTAAAAATGHRALTARRR